MEEVVLKIAELAREVVAIAWKAQGHSLTGNAITQMETRIMQTTKGYDIDGYVLDYMAYNNQGIPASQIPYSPGSGKRYSKYIAELIDYAKRRMGASQRDAQRIAFAIASKHKREGMPTKASARFSSTGRRTGFIEEALDGKEAQFAALIEEAVEVIIFEFFQSVLKR